MPRLDPTQRYAAPNYQQLLGRLHAMTQNAVAPTAGMERDSFVRAGGENPDGTLTTQAMGNVLARFRRLHELVEKLKNFLLRKAPEPAPAPTPAPQPAPATSTYTVVSGDSLSAIAQRTLGNGNRWPEIYELNRDVVGDNPNRIFPGMVLKLPTGSSPAPAPTPAPTPAPAPAGGTYTVGPDDTLSAIAQRTLGDGNRWPEIYELNRDQISNPNVIRAGMVLKLPGGARADAPQPAPSSGGFGSRVIAGSRNLINSGYKYPPNLTDKYYHSPGKVGCCADFVCDANKEAGFDLNGVMKNLGMNPHYCPSMISYFRQHQQFISGKTGAQVGDTVFFSWDGGPSPDHVAVVTAVDAQGRPTRISESYDFNLPARERAIGNSLDNILGYGRVVNR